MKDKHIELKKVLDNFKYFNFNDEDLKNLKINITRENPDLFDYEITIESSAVDSLTKRIKESSFVDRLAYSLERHGDFSTAKKEKFVDKIKLGVIYTGL